MLAGFDTASPADRAEPLDPVGLWNCLVYGHPRRGDERMSFAFDPTGAAYLTRSSDGGGPWVPMSEWIVEDERMRFRDVRSGREFHADVRSTSLGGTWKTLTEVGGWWCSRRDDAIVGEPFSLRGSASRDLLAPLVPDVTASPTYPRQAIREAKEGRAVVCFLVDSEGRIVDPEFIELSDEIFRASTLRALEGSRYRRSDRDGPPRPGCRSFIFALDAVY